jgi:hypothetical protein
VDRTMPELNIPDSFCGLRWTTRISNHWKETEERQGDQAIQGRRRQEGHH